MKIHGRKCELCGFGRVCFDVQSRWRIYQVADRFGSGPKQDSDGDRGADRDRKPIPHTHEWLGVASADSDFGKT